MNKRLLPRDQASLFIPEKNSHLKRQNCRLNLYNTNRGARP